MKTNELKLKWVGVILCMLTMSGLLLVSCSDDKEDESKYDFYILDEDTWRYYDVENLWGVLKYSDVIDAWTIIPDGYQPTPGFPLGGDDTGVLLAIVNMKEEYKQHIDQSVIFKGEAIWKYTAHTKGGILSYDICELTVDNIIPFEAPTFDHLNYVMVDMEVQDQIGTLVYRDYKWYVALANESVIPELADKSGFDTVYISIESPGEEFQAGMDVSYSGKINSAYGWGYGGIMKFADGLRVYLFGGIGNYKITKNP